MKQILLIILLSMVVTVGYGILHNQLTTRINLEYFTIGHCEIVDSVSPTMLGIAWGVYSNWWIGLALGVLLSFAARVGPWIKRDAGSLVKPLLFVSLSAALGAGLAGFLGYKMTCNGALSLSAPLSTSVPFSCHASYIAALWMHTASYFVGVAASLIMVLFIFTGRLHSSKNKSELNSK